MDAAKLIKEIEKLSPEEREKVYSFIASKIKKKEYILNILNEIKGKGKGLWGMDAQEYINKERENDRF